jgi:hypothetical protein
MKFKRMIGNAIICVIIIGLIFMSAIKDNHPSISKNDYT